MCVCVFFTIPDLAGRPFLVVVVAVVVVPVFLFLFRFTVFQVKLAVSLHAANDRERSALLPVNGRFPLAELMDACQEYVGASGRRMTFEWALIQGQNDSAEVSYLVVS